MNIFIILFIRIIVFSDNGTASSRSFAPDSSDGNSSCLANQSSHGAPFQLSGFHAQCQNGPPMILDGTSAPLPGTVNQKFQHAVSANPTYKLMPMPSSNQSFVQRQGDPMMPSSPAQSQPESAAAPPAPSPTVHTVDSSNVPGMLIMNVNLLGVYYCNGTIIKRKTDKTWPLHQF